MFYSRVSTSQIYLSNQSSIMRQSSNLAKLNNMITAKKKVVDASDDPLAKKKIMQENKLLQELETYSDNCIQATSQLEASEQQIQAVYDSVSAIKSLALRMASDTTNDEDKTNAITELNQAKEDIISYLNTELDGFYIFGGYQTSSEAFADDGTYLGDDNARSLEISKSVYKQVNFPGTDVTEFEHTDAAGVTTTLSIMTVIDNLITDLQNSDADSIRDLRIGELDSAIESISHVSSVAGSLVQEVELSKVINDTVKLQSKMIKSDLEDIDVTTALTEYEAAQTALNATMKTTSEALKMTLLNYL